MHQICASAQASCCPLRRERFGKREKAVAAAATSLLLLLLLLSVRFC
jgi:hypothetical protein